MCIDYVLMCKLLKSSFYICIIVNTNANCAKTSFLKLLGERLKFVLSHAAYLLFRYSLEIPKFLSCLRICPWFLYSSLQFFDDELWSTFLIYHTLKVTHQGYRPLCLLSLEFGHPAACYSLVQRIFPPHLIMASLKCL